MTTKDEALRIALEALEKYSLPIDENNLALSCIEYGSDSVGTELLRRKAVAAVKQAQEPTDCKTCNGTGAMDSGGAYPWGEQISVPCYCQAPAPKQAEPSWQPIETAPKVGTRIVVMGDNFGDPQNSKHYVIAAWINGRWAEMSDWNPGSELAYLTHWMPLPTPPEAK